MAKRRASDDEFNEVTPEVKRFYALEPPSIGFISTSKDLDAKVLVIQNQNIYRRMSEIDTENGELRTQIDDSKHIITNQHILISLLMQCIKSNNKDIRELIKELPKTPPDGTPPRACDFEAPYLFIERFIHSSSAIISDEIREIMNEAVENVRRLVQHRGGIRVAIPTDMSYTTDGVSNGGLSLMNMKNLNENVSTVVLSAKEHVKFKALLDECSFFKDRAAFCQDELNRLQCRLDDVTCDLSTVNHRYDVLMARFQAMKQKDSSEMHQPTPAPVEPTKPDEACVDEVIRSELVSFKELATARLLELDQIHRQYKDLVVENARIRLSKASSNTHYTTQAPEYLALQHKYDSLYSDSTQLKQQLDLMRDLFDDVQTQRDNKLDAIKKNIRGFRTHVKELVSRLANELYQTKVDFYKYKFNQSLKYEIAQTVSIDVTVFKTLENLQNENIMLKKESTRHTKEYLEKIVVCEGCVKHSDNSIAFQHIEASMNAIVEELESLTTVYEEIRTQNMQLMQQIHETESAHMKSITENLKLAQHQKIIGEIRETLMKEIEGIDRSQTNNDRVLSGLNANMFELKECVNAVNQESVTKSNLLEVYRKRSLESQQIYSESHIRIQSLNKDLKDSKDTALELTARVETEIFKSRRLQEEISQVRKKLDRATKNQLAGVGDRIASEEIRIYKQKLTCNCCNTRAKDAILSKCFHLFCFECLTATYNSRQRKCPRCGQSFGNNDFHKIYF